MPSLIQLSWRNASSAMTRKSQASTSSQATRNSLLERCIEPVCRMRLLASTAFITSMASWMLCVSGFSQ